MSIQLRRWLAVILFLCLTRIHYKIIDVFYFQRIDKCNKAIIILKTDFNLSPILLEIVFPIFFIIFSKSLKCSIKKKKHLNFWRS